jgi:hypothetical protein
LDYKWLSTCFMQRYFPISVLNTFSSLIFHMLNRKNVIWWPDWRLAPTLAGQTGTKYFRN